MQLSRSNFLVLIVSIVESTLDFVSVECSHYGCFAFEVLKLVNYSLTLDACPDLIF